MKHLAVIISLWMLCLVILPLQAQDATPDKPDFAFQFPLTAPTEAQIQEAFNCALSRESPEATVTPSAQHKPTGCELARQVVVLAAARAQDADPSDDELALFRKMISANPAFALDLSIIGSYYNALPLVEPPDFTNQPITDLNLHYTFSGLGNGVDYTINIANADDEPEVSGVAHTGNDYALATGEPTKEPYELPATVDTQFVQGFGAALRDLLPIGRQFTSTPCWDYYPDWKVDLTFADGTVVNMVTNDSNVVGIGGPWQTEIDGQNYMQYSGAFAEAIGNLFDALGLDFGQTAAMGCGGMNNPLEDAFEIKTSG